MAEDVTTEGVVNWIGETLDKYDISWSLGDELSEQAWELINKHLTDDPFWARVTAVSLAGGALGALGGALKGLPAYLLEQTFRNLPKRMGPALIAAVATAYGARAAEEFGVNSTIGGAASFGVNYTTGAAVLSGNTAGVTGIRTGLGNIIRPLGGGLTNVARVITTPTFTGRLGAAGNVVRTTGPGAMNVWQGVTQTGRGLAQTGRNVAAGAGLIAVPAIVGSLVAEHVVAERLPDLLDFENPEHDAEWSKDRMEEAVTWDAGGYNVPAIDPVLPTMRAHEVVGVVEDMNVEQGLHDDTIKGKTMFVTQEVTDEVTALTGNTTVGTIAGLGAGTVVLAGEVVTEAPATVWEEVNDAWEAWDDLIPDFEAPW